MGSKEIMIGAGYESFWPANLTRIWEKYSFGPNNAHNGYIDVYLDLGILGIILLFILIAKTFSKLAIQIKVSDQYGRLFLIFFIMILIHNVTESSLMKSSLIWFLFLVFSINVVKHPFATGTEEEIRELA
jgi:O-antigen ligase